VILAMTRICYPSLGTARRFTASPCAWEKIGEVLGAVKPEVIYFTDNGVGRGAMMVVDLPSAVQVPHVTEPLMRTFDASVHYRIVMAPEELQSAGLERYATG
jgi:hypothetical protein